MINEKRHCLGTDKHSCDEIFLARGENHRRCDKCAKEQTRINKENWRKKNLVRYREVYSAYKRDSRAIPYFNRLSAERVKNVREFREFCNSLTETKRMSLIRQIKMMQKEIRLEKSKERIKKKAKPVIPGRIKDHA